MKILTKYLLRNLLFPLFYCFLGFVLIFVIDDLFDNFSDFLESGIRPEEMLYYYSQLLPSVVMLTLPVCLLLAMLYSLSQLTRHSEITAMRAGGVSIYRIVLPYIGVGLVATLCSAWINEQVAPDAAWRAEQFLDYQRSGRDAAVYRVRNLAMKDRNHDWMIRTFDTRDHSMSKVVLRENLGEERGSIKYQAEKMLWMDGRWWFMDLTVQRYRDNGDLAGPPEFILQKEMRDLHETPQTFMTEIKEPQYLSSREMLRYLDAKKGLSEETRLRLRVDFHSRLATPFTCLIVTLIGVPIGSHTGRRGAFAGIMLALSLFFGFYILQLVAQGLGKQDIIPAWLGGWLPIILFGLASPVWLYRMR